MKWTEVYPRNYLNTSDIPAGGLHCVIERVTVEDVDGSKSPQSMKPVLYLCGSDKGLVVNKTNGLILRDAYGDDCESVVGQEIKLTLTKVMFQGRMTPSIHVMPVSASPHTPPPQQQMPGGYVQR